MGGRSRGGEMGGEESFRTALGQAVKVLRVDQGLDRRELARRAEISYSYVSEIENGRKPPSSPVLVRIADALGLPLHELLRMAEDRAESGPSSLSVMRRPTAYESREGSPWFHDSATLALRALPSAQPPSAAGSRVTQALQELELLLPRMAAGDIARLLDLARRLAG